MKLFSRQITVGR